MKGRVASWLRMKAEDPDLTNKDIAARLGITVSTLQSCIYQARKQGWLTFEDPFNKIQYEMIPTNIEHMQALMDAGDQKAIIEVFKQLTAPAYRDSQGITKDVTNNIIAIKIEMPPADQMPIVKGVIVGEGRIISGDDD